MKLTCVTAVFNAISSGNRERLFRCVDSVAKLKTEHEHLIYDGASTDGTVDLLRELEAKTPGLKVVSEPDTGIYNALNKGVRDANGEWFYVLGCDDYICFPERLDELVHKINQRTEVVVTPVECNRPICQSFSRKDLKWILCRYAYGHQGVLVRTKIMRRFGGFDERYRICADGDLWMRLHKNHVAYEYVFSPFAFFYVGGTNVKFQALMAKEMYDFLSRHIPLSSKESDAFRSSRLLPARRLLPYLLHKDFALRTSARFMLKKVLLYRLKMFLRFILYPLVVATRGWRHKATD